MPPLHFFYPHQEHPLHKKDKKKRKHVKVSQPGQKIKLNKKKKKRGLEGELILRILPRRNSYQKKSQVSGKKADTTLSKSSAEASSMIELKNMMKALTDKVEELQKRNTQVTNQQQQATAAGNGGSGVLCYACNQRGHIARNCPDKQRVQSTSGTGSGQPPNQGRTDSRGGRRENPLN